MKNLGSPDVSAALIDRFRALRSDSARQWGTMNAQQMAQHIGDASGAVLKQREFYSKGRKPSRFAKLLVIYILPRFPRGVRAGANPAAKQVDVAAFAADVDRAVTLLHALATAREEDLADRHPIFGAMSRSDWMRWAYLHTDHHLRQFGV